MQYEPETLMLVGIIIFVIDFTDLLKWNELNHYHIKPSGGK